MNVLIQDRPTVLLREHEHSIFKLGIAESKKFLIQGFI